MNDNRYLRAAALLVGLLILTLALVDYLLAVWPIQPRELAWRYGAMTTLSGSLVITSLAVLLVFGSLAGRHRWPQLALSGLVGAIGLMIVAGWVIFILDVLQVRGTVRPEVLREYDLTAGRSLLKLALGSMAALAFSLLAFLSARSESRPEPNVGRPGGLVRPRGAGQERQFSSSATPAAGS